jgi:hypothetical protein
MGGGVLEWTGGDKDLIAPVYRETSWTRWGVDTSLANHGFEDSNWFLGAGREFVANWEFLSCRLL